MPYRRLIPTAVLLTTALGCAGTAWAGGVCEDLEKCPCVVEMVESIARRGWVGISMESDEHGWALTEVVPGGPAEAAGLLPGDRLLAMNGVAMTREQEKQLAKIYDGMLPGAKIAYTIERAGKKRQVTVVLGRLPGKMMALFLGQYLLESYEASTGESVLPPKHPAPKPPVPPKPKGDG